jgi:cysteine-S-conjugate beta-lyase
MKKETKLVHKGRNPSAHSGAVNPPIYSSSTIIFPDLASFRKAEKGEVFYKPIYNATVTEPTYGISGNQTSFALQEVIRELEGDKAKISLLAPSGLSAITATLMALLQSGDHVLVADNIYGPTRRFCNQTLKNFNIETTYYDPEIGGDITKLFKPNTKVIFMESPGSLTFEVQDIESIVKSAKAKDIFTVIDNSWASPLYLRPLDHGIDVSIHALTKYVNGHSDILMGSITANERTAELIFNSHKNSGSYVSPYDCSLVLRGIRSMNARLEYQQQTLEKVLQYLETVKCVKEILCPSYPKFKGHELWKKYFTGATPLFSILLDRTYSDAEMAKMFDGYKLFAIGNSWGGFESLVRFTNVNHLIRTATKGKYQNSIVRIYLGLESADDLIKDLDEGFKRLVK